MSLLYDNNDDDDDNSAARRSSSSSSSTASPAAVRQYVRLLHRSQLAIRYTPCANTLTRYGLASQFDHTSLPPPSLPGFSGYHLHRPQARVPPPTEQTGYGSQAPHLYPTSRCCWPAAAAAAVEKWSGKQRSQSTPRQKLSARQCRDEDAAAASELCDL